MAEDTCMVNNTLSSVYRNAVKNDNCTINGYSSYNTAGMGKMQPTKKYIKCS
jgi:hypothetical protein